MIRSWRHKGLRDFFETGSKKGIQSKHATKLADQLSALNIAKMPEDMDQPGWKLHPLKSRDKGQWSVWVNGNWRVTFAFEDENVIIVDYRDYH